MTHKPESDAEMAAIRVSGQVTPLNAQVYLAPYDPAWPEQFEAMRTRILGALGERALRIEHVGSTSIPGVCAKPVIDVVLEVADSTDEAAYVPPLEAAGFRLHLREPNWLEHRVLKGDAPLANLHVFSRGSPETARMVAFRDRCRADPDERRLYEETKRALAGQVWRHVQHYANAKSEVVEAIIARARTDGAERAGRRQSPGAGVSPRPV